MSLTRTMKTYIAILVLALLGSRTESSPQATLKTFTLEEVVPLRPEFYPERLSVQWISDTEFIEFDPIIGIRKYDASTDTFVTVLDPVDLYNLNGHEFTSFSNDAKSLLMAANRKKVYRHSSIAEYSVFDLEKRTLMPIAKGPLQVVVWGEGRSLAYVKDNNVYYLPDAYQPETVTALTNEGVVGEVYFGVNDWIYEEEVFTAAEALWFSPSGTYLAVASFNDTLVESVEYPFYGNPGDINFQYAREIRFKYPKAGRTNPVVGLRVFKVNDPQTDAWNIPAPVDVVGLDHILARVTWATDVNLVVLWMNRRQNISVLVNCELQTDKCSIIRQRVEPNGWIEVDEPFFDRTGTKMIEIEPQELGDRRLMHAARYDLNYNTIEDLTPINATVTEILAWNEPTGTLYYVVSPSEAPWLRQLWASSHGVIRCISSQQSSCHYVTAMFSQGGSYGVVTCSASNHAPKIFLYSSVANNFKLIRDNSRLVEVLSHYKLPMNLFNIIPLEQDVFAHIELTLPPEMKPGHKYPMVVRVYAGPRTSRVKDNYKLAYSFEYYNTYLSVNRSFIVAAIDVRGSGVMDVEALYSINNALGTVEITDTLHAIRQLAKLYSFIDPERIGVWGWSYGGFATTLMMMKDDEKTIACGAAVAPVTSWLYYDSIYTERYMDLPQANPVGYAQSDLTAQAEKLRGRKYLLVHGTGDDNVHFQHSLQLAKALQHADIDFEQVSYTDENHSLLGVSRHFYHTLDRFWTQCFK